MATTTQQRSGGRRLSAEERREQVVEAAVAEFGERGYHAASTAGIAKRAGISQPYIYALFADKHELFLAVHDRVVDRIRAAFLEAARGTSTPEEALHAMGMAYRPLMQDPRYLSAHLQCFAAAAGDPELRKHVGARFRRMVDDVARISGADEEAVAAFISCGMYINIALAIGEPDLVEPLLYENKTDEPDPSTAAPGAPDLSTTGPRQG
ncbi:MAG: TetR/AcrR family transcriptional regulator [Solirubrobacteraceae bacterium]